MYAFIITLLFIVFIPLFCLSMERKPIKKLPLKEAVYILSNKFDRKYCERTGCRGGEYCHGHENSPDYTALKLLYIFYRLKGKKIKSKAMIAKALAEEGILVGAKL